MSLRQQIEEAEMELEALEKEKLLTISKGFGEILDITTARMKSGLRQAFFLLFGIAGILSVILAVLALHI